MCPRPPCVHARSAASGRSDVLAQAVELLKTQYLEPRRFHLFATHSVCDIPAGLSETPLIVINEIM